MARSNNTRKRSEVHHTAAIENFHRNLTMREVIFPYFIFNIVNKKCSPISLSGTEPNLVTADCDELGPSATIIFLGRLNKKREDNFFTSNGLSGGYQTIFLTFIWKWFHFDVRFC